jgi:hypothetical protein
MDWGLVFGVGIMEGYCLIKVCAWTTDRYSCYCFELFVNHLIFLGNVLEHSNLIDIKDSLYVWSA